jgi:hypothetical protein
MVTFKYGSSNSRGKIIFGLVLINQNIICNYWKGNYLMQISLFLMYILNRLYRSMSLI